MEKFPKSFVSDITKKTNKELLYMTLENTFEKKELYKQDDIVNYKHNLEVIKNEKIQKNKEQIENWELNGLKKMETKKNK